MTFAAIGHGGLGLRSNLRSFFELAEMSYCERVAFADVGLGKELTAGWTLDGGGFAWYQTVSQTFDNVVLEMVSVLAAPGDVLDRVERLADVTATAGTFSYDSATGVLYVRLTGDVNPNSTAVEAVFVKRFGSGGSVEPLFGPEKLTDPNLQDWATSNDLTSYNEVNVGVNGISVRQIVEDGQLVAEIRPGTSGMTAGTFGGIQQAGHIGVAGGLYWAAIEYATDPVMPTNLSARLRVRVSPVGNAIVEDGRSQTAVTDGLELQLTGGQRRRAIFPFRCPTDITGMALAGGLLSSSSVTTGWLRIYGFVLRRVYRYEYVEPRMPPGGVGAIDLSSPGVYMGEESIGQGSLRLLNSDDEYFENLLGSYDIIGRFVQRRRGGGFGDQEITFDDTFAEFPGLVQDFNVDDLGASMSLRDTRSVMTTVLPLRTADKLTFPNMADKDVGKYRALLFGTVEHIAPLRKDYDATSFLPVYEVADGTDAPGTVMAVSAVYAYTDEEAAAVRDTSRRITVPGSAYSVSGGVLSITANPGPFVVLSAGYPGPAGQTSVMGLNNALDLVADGTTYEVFLTPGLYTAATLATHVEALLDALAPAADFTVTYSNSNHKFTITYTGATLQLLIDTGVNNHRSAYPLMGFDGPVDRIGSVTYESDTAVHDLARVDSFTIRVNASGLTDDASGTYTGTASAAIIKAPDIWRYVWRRLAGRPSTEIDTATFLAGRTSTPQPMAFYLGGVGVGLTVTLQELADRLCFGTHTDLQPDGTGKWFWNPRPTSAASVTAAASAAPTLYDRDFIAFSSGKVSDDCFAAVRVNYSQDPVTGQAKNRSAAAVKTPVRHGRAQAREFETFLANETDAQSQAWNLMLLAVEPRRWLDFTVKGKLIRLLPGSLIKVQRDRMLGAEVSGMLNSDVFRIATLRIDPQTHVVQCRAYTADLPRNLDNVTPLATVLRVPANQWKPFLWAAPGTAGIAGPFRPARVGPSP